MIITFFYVASLACLVWLLLNRNTVRMNVHLRKENMELMQELVDQTSEHQRVFQEMISRVHHQGIVPISATALGLTFVISLEVTKCIVLLQKLQLERDWQTSTVSTELLRLLAEEMSLLQFKLKELNEEIKRVVNEYDEYQRNMNYDS